MHECGAVDEDACQVCSAATAEYLRQDIATCKRRAGRRAYVADYEAEYGPLSQEAWDEAAAALHSVEPEPEG